ncbi:MAG TPA: ABC transporter permease [Candidatus Cryptobacteroides pullicola]|nr:ABC transporter permease [Candidatus Cryptobacteroides pullicola]
MNLRTIGIVIGREYSTRVRKKSFLLTTFITPILFAALCLVPAFLMTNMKESAKRLAVVDNSGIVLPCLEDGETVSYVDMSSSDADSVKTRLAELGCDGVLVVSPLDSAAKTISAEIYSPSPLGIDLEENLGNRLDDALENYRIESYGIEGLAQIMEDVKVNVPLRSYTISDDGEEKVSESGVYMLVSMILGMVIYMFIVMFGAMVMSSVIEEKSSRVVEVLVSSVKATELMFGKIIGIAFVALTQFLLWIVLTVVIVGVVGVLAGPSLASGLDPAEMSQMAGMDVGQLAQMTGSPELGVIISSLSNMHLGTILVCFLIFFVLGYMLYASLFAAIGSAVENEGDSSQLQMPVTVPLMIAFFVALYAFKAPESTLVFWCSLIPFTSPIVMLARLPYGVPAWELVLSIVLLALTFALCAWLSAKIYKVGILMFGKKTTWKDLWKWLKQK